MITLLSALVLSQAQVVARPGRNMVDAGVAWPVYIEGSGLPSSSAPSYVNVLVDGGWMTVTVLNPTPTYVNALIDGGWVTATVINPVSYVNATIDGGVINTIPRKVAAAALASAFSCTSAAAPAPTTALANRTSLCITNLSPHTTVYVGHAAVTASTGTALAPAPTQTDGGTGVGGTYCDDVGAQPLSCITSTGTADVRLLEQ